MWRNRERLGVDLQDGWEGRTDQRIVPRSQPEERVQYERQQTQPQPALPHDAEASGGHLPVVPPRRVDERAPVQRPVARRLPEEGAVRPEQTAPNAQRRIPQMPGYHGDEFLA